MLRATLFALLASAILPGQVRAEEAAQLPPSAEQEVDFVRTIQPLLKARCYSCHGPEEEEGGLRLDVKARALAGGDSGRAIVAGKSAQSRLVRMIAGVDEDYGRMPPEGEGTPLTAEQVSLVRAWIDQGANWPADADAATVGRGSDHWAFQPIARPEPPSVKQADWVRSPIDRFVLARLEKEKISPADEAKKTTLIRRLHFDLLGLPPSPEQVDAFLADESPDAYERLVDRLLASPHYGERWARHWLDLARYADSDGYEKDRPRPHAWRYRQWVINALNGDVPYDKFSVRQIAGDMLPEGDRQDLVATGFHRNTLHNAEGGVDREEDRVKKTVDRTNTVGTIWLGLTVGCAQCHSHKYDPITQREYYSFYALFNSMNETTAKLQGKAQARAVNELSKPRTTYVHLRGDFLQKGDRVQPDTFEILPELESPSAAAEESDPPTDRLAFARWLFRPDHPLTARVAANRVWMRFFGRGIVATEDDFGTQGDRPSHPQLLDYLAAQLKRRDWSLKHLHRLIVTSAVYRQSSRARPELEAGDPENRRLARQTRRRVEAEIVRDVSLAVSGLLDRRVGGPSVHPPQPGEYDKLTYNNKAKWRTSTGGDRVRRGLYTFFQRTSPYPMLMTFDSPDSNLICTRRAVSNTPLQALTLWNDVVFFECAQALGRRLLRDVPAANKPVDKLVATRAERAFRLCAGRRPTGEELAALTSLYHQQLDLCREDPKAAAAIVGKVPLPDATQPAEAAAWILVARTTLNLDETLTRE